MSSKLGYSGISEKINIKGIDFDADTKKSVGRKGSDIESGVIMLGARRAVSENEKDDASDSEDKNISVVEIFEPRTENFAENIFENENENRSNSNQSEPEQRSKSRRSTMNDEKEPRSAT